MPQLPLQPSDVPHLNVGGPSITPSKGPDLDTFASGVYHLVQATAYKQQANAYNRGRAGALETWQSIYPALQKYRALHEHEPEFNENFAEYLDTQLTPRRGQRKFGSQKEADVYDASITQLSLSEQNEASTAANKRFLDDNRAMVEDNSKRALAALSVASSARTPGQHSEVDQIYLDNVAIYREAMITDANSVGVLSPTQAYLKATSSNRAAALLRMGEQYKTGSELFYTLQNPNARLPMPRFDANLQPIFDKNGHLAFEPTPFLPGEKEALLARALKLNELHHGIWKSTRDIRDEEAFTFKTQIEGEASKAARSGDALTLDQLLNRQNPFGPGTIIPPKEHDNWLKLADYYAQKKAEGTPMPAEDYVQAYNKAVSGELAHTDLVPYIEQHGGKASHQQIDKLLSAITATRNRSQDQAMTQFQAELKQAHAYVKGLLGYNSLFNFVKSAALYPDTAMLINDEVQRQLDKLGSNPDPEALRTIHPMDIAHKTLTERFDVYAPYLAKDVALQGRVALPVLKEASKTFEELKAQGTVSGSLTWSHVFDTLKNEALKGNMSEAEYRRNAFLLTRWQRLGKPADQVYSDMTLNLPRMERGSLGLKYSVDPKGPLNITVTEPSDVINALVQSVFEANQEEEE